MKQQTLTRRLIAGTVGLMIGLVGAAALVSPAHAEGEDQAPAYTPPKSLNVSGSVVCDEETGQSTVEWTVTNTSTIGISAAITGVEPDEVGDIVVGAPLNQGESLTGTQTFDAGEADTATLEVELTWTWTTWKRVKVGWGPWSTWKKERETHTKTKSASDTVDLEDCRPDDEPDPKLPPVIVITATCELLVFLVDNSEGDAEAGVTFTPNQAVKHGHASGFSYSIVDDELEVFIDEDAGIDGDSEDADSENPIALTFPAGADVHAHAIEGAAGLEVAIAVTLDGEEFVYTDDEGEPVDVVLSWEDLLEEFGIDCDVEPGELPVTGMTTGLIALGALVLLTLGGGLFMVARRRRVTFTA